MIRNQSIRKFALSLPETDEHPHFDRMAFRVKKKIFATLHEKNRTLNLKLTPVDQSVFCSIDPPVIYPVPGNWGRSGWTTVDLEKAPLILIKDAMKIAYCTVAPGKLAQGLRSK